MSSAALGTTGRPRRGGNNSHYGRKFEWSVRDRLRDYGFDVLRMAGSAGSAKADLIAVRVKPGYDDSPVWPDSSVGDHLWVQCKTSGTIGPAEWNKFYECACLAGAIPILASKGEPGGVSIILEELTGFRESGSRTWLKKPYRLT